MLYYRTTENKYQLSCMTYVDNVVMTGLSFILEDDTDIMELFAEEKKEEEEEDKKEKEDNSLEDFFNDNPGNVVRKLREMYPDVVSDIENEVISHLRDYDLADSDIECFAQKYIRNNPIASVIVAEDYLDGYDKKKFIRAWIDEI